MLLCVDGHRSYLVVTPANDVHHHVVAAARWDGPRPSPADFGTAPELLLDRFGHMSYAWTSGLAQRAARPFFVDFLSVPKCALEEERRVESDRARRAGRIGLARRPRLCGPARRPSWPLVGICTVRLSMARGLAAMASRLWLGIAAAGCPGDHVLHNHIAVAINGLRLRCPADRVVRGCGLVWSQRRVLGHVHITVEGVGTELGGRLETTALHQLNGHHVDIHVFQFGGRGACLRVTCLAVPTGPRSLDLLFQVAEHPPDLGRAHVCVRAHRRRQPCGRPVHIQDRDAPMPLRKPTSLPLNEV